MNSQELFKQICAKKSFLCVGLDTDLNKIPDCLRANTNAMFAFNKAIIDATAEYAVALKPNLAFYEAAGEKGLAALKQTVQYARNRYPDLFLIADAKRGDIGNTSQMYAQAFFEHLDFDAGTLSPYMGKDTVAPFFTFNDKWAILRQAGKKERAKCCTRKSSKHRKLGETSTTPCMWLAQPKPKCCSRSGKLCRNIFCLFREWERRAEVCRR